MLCCYVKSQQFYLIHVFLWLVVLLHIVGGKINCTVASHISHVISHFSD